jgi:activating signal cointegrator complex subunit 2
LNGDLKVAEAQLKRLNHLLHASPEAAAFFMAGSDFLDSLIGCYKIMNPPLRTAILSGLYLCLIGLTEGEKPNFSSLVDQLYSLKAAAEAHKAGPLNVNDSLVAELVTATPILKQVQHRIEANGSGSIRAKSVITALESFRKPNHPRRSRHLIKRKINKGKATAKQSDEYGYVAYGQVHIHRMSLVTQVQDLFPNLGSGFVVKLLDEYNDNVEQVISHLLEGRLPSHLEKADRSEELYEIPLLTRNYLTIPAMQQFRSQAIVHLISLPIPHLHSCQPVITYSMMTNSTSLSSIARASILAAETLIKQPTTFCKIAPMFLIKQQFFLPLQLSTQMMTSVTIPTTLKT